MPRPLTRVLKPLVTPSFAGRSSVAPQKIITKPELFKHNDQLALLRRQRKTEWKRRQGGQSFLDYLVINIKGGNGGNGCVAFHREKFKPFGPPSGGNGGRGGDVHILPTPHLTTLSSLPKRIHGQSGGHGRGTWQNGKNGAPVIIKVPLGTVVKEVREAVPDVALKIENRWVHYPGYHEDNVQRDTFKEAEASLYRQEREWKFARRQQALDSISLDLDKLEDTVVPVDAPLGTRHHEAIGHIVAAGGQGGLGNPHFLSPTNRSPKFATRGREGESVTLALELKLLADVGLVGMPNAGKSTLLRALTGGRAKSEVAGYAFTTLNPVVGVVRVAEDGTFEGDLDGGKVHDETWVERQRELEVMGTGWSNALSDQTDSFKRAVESLAETPDAGLERRCRPGHYFDTVESFRFTVADNPGLISRASENVGLGHSFLRSMERSLALVYVVDLSGSSPWDELGVLRDELEKYKPGMSAKARMVIANKADLLGAESQVAVEEAREKLRQLEQFVDTKMAMVGKGGNGETTKRTLEVVPTSAKFSQNMRKVVSMLRTYVEEAREQEGKKRNSS